MLAAVLVLFVASAIAFVLSAICGGGAGLLLIPILGLYLPITSVPAALSLGTASSSLSRIAAFRSDVRWSITRIFVPASIPGVWLGSWLLQYVNPLYLQLGMGLFLVGNISALVRRAPAGEAMPAGAVSLAGVGFLVGFVSGVTGAVGLLFNSFYLRQGMSKEEIVATRAANEVVLQLVKLVLYGLFGLLNEQTLYLGATVAVAAILSSLSMKKVLPLLGYEQFRKVGYGAMVLSGALLLGQAGRRLVIDNRGEFALTPVAKGVESKIHWANTNFSVEFVYDEGFEYEQVVTFEDLPPEKRAFVEQQTEGADDVLIEEVFGFREHGYELYLRRGTDIRKFEF